MRQTFGRFADWASVDYPLGSRAVVFYATGLGAYVAIVAAAAAVVEALS